MALAIAIGEPFSTKMAEAWAAISSLSVPPVSVRGLLRGEAFPGGPSPAACLADAVMA